MKMNKAGFTLIEVIIAIAIFTTVVFLGYNIINKNTSLSSNQKQLTELSQGKTLINTYLTKDIDKITGCNKVKLSDENYKYVMNINDTLDIEYSIILKKENNIKKVSILRDEIKNGKNISSIELIKDIQVDNDNNRPLEILKDNKLYTVKLNITSDKNSYVFQNSSKKISSKIVSNSSYLNISDHSFNSSSFNRYGYFVIQSREEPTLFPKPDYANNKQNYQTIPIDIRAGYFSNGYQNGGIGEQYIIYTPYYKSSLNNLNGFTDSKQDKNWYNENYGNPRKIVQQYDVTITANKSNIQLSVDGIRYSNGDIVASDNIKQINVDKNINENISIVEFMFDDETKVVNLDINGMKPHPSDANKIIQHKEVGYTYYTIEGFDMREDFTLKFSIQTVPTTSIDPDQRLGISFGYK